MRFRRRVAPISISWVSKRPPYQRAEAAFGSKKDSRASHNLHFHHLPNAREERLNLAVIPISSHHGLQRDPQKHVALQAMMRADGDHPPNSIVLHARWEDGGNECRCEARLSFCLPCESRLRAPF